ncbi:argininosuccinate lyase [Aliikangiella sp. IMCC44653]
MTKNIAPIWQKAAAQHSTTAINEFMVGEDTALDAQLIEYDIRASKAHLAGLFAINQLSSQEKDLLTTALDKLQAQIDSGLFTLDSRFEDGHSAIEYFLIEQLGDIGKKVHLGRSRNDQVLVATRLYLKSQLIQAKQSIHLIIQACLSQAETNKMLAIPGYTHLQRAVPSTAGLWFASFAESFIDNLLSLKASLQLVDANPLGTAAGYGVNLPLDRALTTQLLEFERLQINPLYAQNSRGKIELNVLNTLAQCLLDIRRFCWDVSLFTSQEFSFIQLPDAMTTGSSIMPNKNNPDLVELMRAKYATLQGAINEIQSLLSLPSGYQRDLQLIKAPMLRGVSEALKTLALFPELIKGIKFNQAAIAQSFEIGMLATDRAVELAASGVPFRDAYQKNNLAETELTQDLIKQSIKQRISAGACANLMLAELEQRWTSLNDTKN